MKKRISSTETCCIPPLVMKRKSIPKHYPGDSSPGSFTRAHRILHWLIAFTFLFIIVTVLLRMGWMNKDHMAAITSGSLHNRQVNLSREDAIAVGRAIRRPMWDIHIYAGYVLIALYCIRLAVMRIEGPVFRNPFSGKLSRKERFKSWVYLVFYVCLGISLSTGACIEFIGKRSPGTYAVMKAVHVQSLYYSLAFIFLHVGGLVLAELGSDQGIISRMVHGKPSPPLS
jgi:cytochrome b561